MENTKVYKTLTKVQLRYIIKLLSLDEKERTKMVNLMKMFKKSETRKYMYSKITDSRFEGKKIQEAYKLCTFENVVFNDCIINNVFYKCKFDNCIFENCIIVSWFNESELVNCEFPGCKIQSNFETANLYKMDFSKSRVIGSKLQWHQTTNYLI